MNFLKRHLMVCLMLAVAAGMALAADPSGKWTWTYKAGKKDMQKGCFGYGRAESRERPAHRYSIWAWQEIRSCGDQGWQN